MNTSSIPPRGGERVSHTKINTSARIAQLLLLLICGSWLSLGANRKPTVSTPPVQLLNLGCVPHPVSTVLTAQIDRSASSVTITWSLLEGPNGLRPGEVILQSPHKLTCPITISTDGIFRFQILVTDRFGAKATGVVTVEANLDPGNIMGDVIKGTVKFRFQEAPLATWWALKKGQVIDSVTCDRFGAYAIHSGIPGGYYTIRARFSGRTGQSASPAALLTCGSSSTATVNVNIL